MDLSVDNIESLIQGYCYGKLIKERLIDSYPTSQSSGFKFYIGKYDFIYDRKKEKEFSLKSFKELYRDKIEKEYLFLKKRILIENKLKIEKELRIIENKHIKGTKPKTHMEKTFTGLWYFHKYEFYRIKHVKENNDNVTYVVKLKSGKFHTIHMNKLTFLKRSYFAGIH